MHPIPDTILFYHAPFGDSSLDFFLGVPDNVWVAGDACPPSIFGLKIAIVSELYLSLELTLVVVANSLELVGLEEAHYTYIHFYILLYTFKGDLSLKKSVRYAWVLVPYGIVGRIGPRKRRDYEDHVLATQPLPNRPKYGANTKRERRVNYTEFVVWPLILEHIEAAFCAPIGLESAGIQVPSCRTKKSGRDIFNQGTFCLILILY